MDKTINIRGLKPGDKQEYAIQNYINDNLVKIEKLVESWQEPIFLNFTLDSHPTHDHHICDLRIHGPLNFEIITKREGPDFYKLIDEILDITFRDLVRYKEKLQHWNRTVDKY